mmetsp:Transcript_142683/g.355632  ORF Transcript_142683/g.355632 Transcript_142683/m.355632 type:complete len:301 (+) Transcript_142683:345-1247(+)
MQPPADVAHPLVIAVGGFFCDPERQVVHEGPLEEHWLERDVQHTQVRGHEEAGIFDVCARQDHAADDLEKCRLPMPSVAHQSYYLTLLDVQSPGIVQPRTSCTALIRLQLQIVQGDRHVVDVWLAAILLHLLSQLGGAAAVVSHQLSSLRDVRWQVFQPHNSLHGWEASLHLQQNLVDDPPGFSDLRIHLDVGQEDAQGHVPGDGLLPAHDDVQRDDADRHPPREVVVDAEHPRGACEGSVELFDHLLEGVDVGRARVVVRDEAVVADRALDVLHEVVLGLVHVEEVLCRHPHAQCQEAD